MPTTSPFLTRRALLAAALAAPALISPARAAGDWENLFDGHSLTGWTPSENKGSWSVADGTLSGDGSRSHLFYSGPVMNATFQNFELEFEAITQPAANSGVYFHTTFQEKGFPNKGFEIQVNNTAGGEGTYRERKKTGSLYGLRNVYKQIVLDGEGLLRNGDGGSGEWFRRGERRRPRWRCELWRRMYR